MHKANGITRGQILTSIKVNGSMTADLLAQELGISPVAVRQHLSSLEAEGHIKTSVERRGLGRPVHRYSVTAEGDESFPRSYDRIANDILDELRVIGGEESVDAIFAARQDSLQTRSQARFNGKSLLARVEELAKLQSEYGFMADSRQVGEDILLIEHNCAICRVARNNRGVCAHEMIMLRNVAGSDADVTREQYILDGDSTCTYRFRPITKA
jgi:predicted ArsR family transcriptional regulator